MEDDAETIPDPTSISELSLASGQVPVLIEVWMPAIRDEIANKAVNRPLTLPK